MKVSWYFSDGYFTGYLFDTCVCQVIFWEDGRAMVRAMSGKNVWILTEHGRVVNLLFKIILEWTFHNSGLLFQMLQLICSDLNNNVCTNKIVFCFNLTFVLVLSWLLHYSFIAFFILHSQMIPNEFFPSILISILGPDFRNDLCGKWINIWPCCLI